MFERNDKYRYESWRERKKAKCTYLQENKLEHPHDWIQVLDSDFSLGVAAQH